MGRGTPLSDSVGVISRLGSVCGRTEATLILDELPKLIQYYLSKINKHHENIHEYIHIQPTYISFFYTQIPNRVTREKREYYGIRMMCTCMLYYGVLLR